MLVVVIALVELEVEDVVHGLAGNGEVNALRITRRVSVVTLDGWGHSREIGRLFGTDAA